MLILDWKVLFSDCSQPPYRKSVRHNLKVSSIINKISLGVKWSISSRYSEMPDIISLTGGFKVFENPFHFVKIPASLSFYSRVWGCSSSFGEVMSCLNGKVQRSLKRTVKQVTFYPEPWDISGWNSIKRLSFKTHLIFGLDISFWETNRQAWRNSEKILPQKIFR